MGQTSAGRTLWIGGSPCSGKSTVAAIVAASRGVAVYSCDAAFDRHAAEISPQAGPTLRTVARMGVGERLAQPIDTQVSDVFRLYREEFPLIWRDVAQIGGGPVVEGAALLPDLLAAAGVPAHRAVWIVPAEEFQRRHYRRRRWARDLLADDPDPERAFDRWMRRDARFAVMVAEQARDLGYRVVVTDGSTSAARIATAIDRGLAS